MDLTDTLAVIHHTGWLMPDNTKKMTDYDKAVVMMLVPFAIVFLLAIVGSVLFAFHQ
jgi:hypothetical protein